MYKSVVVYESADYNPYRNLAVESALFDTAKEGILYVYLWQNDKTVVIGRNQNAYLDVNVQKLYSDGGLLARRPTGGGAVYHDKGNLNFSFITGRKGYDVAEDNEIILNAVKALGLRAEVTGRNDMVIGGRKFSGHAYLKTNKAALHHGTVLVCADAEVMGNYLNVKADKLAGKGVTSVKARVVNLAEIDDDITVSAVKLAITSYLQKTYTSVTTADIADIDSGAVAAYENKYSDKAYLFGSEVKLESNRYKRFEWGYADVHFTLCEGLIKQLEIYSDGLDTASVLLAEKQLIGASVTDDIKFENQIAKDVFSLLK